MELIYQDRDIVVCVKPARALSTDLPGGVPELVRRELGDEKANIRTVHRLDRVSSGLMVLARNAKAAAELSRQIREGEFGKEYQIVVHGHPDSTQGTMEDLLLRNKEERKTYVVTEPGKDAQQAILHYQVMNSNDALTRVHVNLQTGRTHQIRVQFSSRGMPLVGDRKYSTLEDDCEIALWSYRLTFFHPYTGEQMEFTLEPPVTYPWTAV